MSAFNLFRAAEFVPSHSLPAVADIKQLQQFIDSSRRLYVVTGAGISTESGLPDYRCFYFLFFFISSTIYWCLQICFAFSDQKALVFTLEVKVAPCSIQIFCDHRKLEIATGHEIMPVGQTSKKSSRTKLIN